MVFCYVGDCFPISIHAPPRGATAELLARFQPTVFQFTPLREGRPPASRRSFPGGQISIHAPPRGATCAQSKRNARRTFQFTPLREGRHGVLDDVNHLLVISIHAPPRGATLLGEQVCGRQEDFNSRPSARGDYIVPSPCCQGAFQFTPLREGRLCMEGRKELEHLFQFTPLREGRRIRAKRSPQAAYFNSRPSARGDVLVQQTVRDLHLFQFTPLREGRQSSATCSARCGIFQFTPLREGRPDGACF